MLTTIAEMSESDLNAALDCAESWEDHLTDDEASAILDAESQ